MAREGSKPAADDAADADADAGSCRGCRRAQQCGVKILQRTACGERRELLLLCV